ncbi:hypothetical protein B0H10DRAFT_2029060 [Mycena sp. CBHHK59/15]|nr:hypothetical protein B0H10DRAFT_2029060 [Mycena sp. CBHHK59/15]
MSSNQSVPGMPFTDFASELQIKIWCAAELIGPFLSSPDNSPLCAATVYKITQRLLPFDAEAKTCVRLLRQHQACLDGLVHIMAIPRTQTQLEGLETRLNECRCDLSDEVLQTIHDHDNDIQAVMLSGPKIGHLLGAQSAAMENNSKTKKWPSNTEVLFPAGPEAAVVSFARLYRLTKSARILDFIRTIFPHCPSIAMPVAKVTLFWDAFVEGLQLAVDHLRTDPAMTGADPEQADSAQGTTPRNTVMAVAMFLSPFIGTYTESLRQNITSSCLMSHGRKIHDLLLKALFVAKDSPNQEDLATFCFLVAAMAVQVATVLPKHQRPHRLHPLLLKYGLVEGSSKAHAFTEVFAVIGRVTSVAQCCNAACAETSESSSQKLRYCARCRVMRYCSGTCQKTAWKYHKTVCKDLERLNRDVMPLFSGEATGQPGESLDEFEKEARKLGFTEDRMKEISAELMPFLHFQNAGMKSAPSHEKANHY